MDENLLRFDKKQTILVFDFEACNLNLSFVSNRPWQVGILKCRGDEVIDKYISYIKWDKPLVVSPDAAEKTKYNPYDVEKYGNHHKEVFSKMNELLQECSYCIIHNGLGYDIYLLKDWYKLMGLDWKFLPNKILDTNALARGLKSNIPYKKDENLLEYQYKMVHFRAKGIKTNLKALGHDFDISFDPEQLHQAQNDILLNFQIWNKMKWQLSI